MPEELHLVLAVYCSFLSIGRIKFEYTDRTVKDRKEVIFIVGLYFGKRQVDKCTLEIQSLVVKVL